MKNKNKVLWSLSMVTQFGISMIVPIVLCTMAGVYIGNKFKIEFIVIPLFFLGALAGFRNVYRMAKKIFEQESDRDTKHAAKTE